MPYEPNGPGWKQGATSADAAAKIAPRAETLRQMALDALRAAGEPMTADEIAARLCQDRLSIRPRISELKSAGRVVDSGQRGKTQAGKNAVRWRIAGAGGANHG